MMSDPPGDIHSPDSDVEQASPMQMSSAKMQELRAKYMQLMQQKQGATVPLKTKPSEQTVHRESSLPSSPISSSVVSPAQNPNATNKLYSQNAAKIQDRPIVEVPSPESKKFRINMPVAPPMKPKEPTPAPKGASTSQIGSSSKIGSSSRINPADTGTTSRTCIQQVPMVLDVAQSILEKAIYELMELCPDLDLPHYCHKALKRIQEEAIKMQAQNEPVYQNLFEILQHKIYVLVLFKSEQSHWGNLHLTFAETLLLQKQPCKVFYFVLRMLALFLHALQKKLTHEQKISAAFSMLKILETSSQFLKKGKRSCYLKGIFHIARHHALQKEVPCCSQDDEEVERSNRQDIFAVQDDESSQRLDLKESLQRVSPIGAPSDSVFYGNLAYISIWQVFQILAMEEKSGCLIIQGSFLSKVFLQKGLVVHCESGGLVGEEAFYSVLYEQKGTFTFELQSPPQLSMNHPVEFLLMEGARRMDEQHR